jgi:hypothetical protein
MPGANDVRKAGMLPLLPETTSLKATSRSRALILALSGTLLSFSPVPSNASIRTTEIQSMKAQTMHVPATGILAHAASGPVQCEIRRNDSANAVELIGIVISDRAIAGHANFTILKSGTAGTSNIRQGNHFAVDAGKEAVVGQAKIGLEQGARISVELSVKSDDGLECRVMAPLEH